MPLRFRLLALLGSVLLGVLPLSQRALGSSSSLHPGGAVSGMEARARQAASLGYQGGPVLRSTVSYAIFWAPTGTSYEGTPGTRA